MDVGIYVPELILTRLAHPEMIQFIQNVSKEEEKKIETEI